MPLPDNDFDVTEVAVPWHILTAAGHRVTFATERAGTRPAADSRLLTGVLLGKLGAAAEAQLFYRQLTIDDDFLRTISWADIVPADFDGLILPGGHAPGMRQYLSALVLQEKAARFWALGRPVGAICHGTLVLARTPAPGPGPQRAGGPPHHLPAQVHGTRRVPAHRMAPRPLLPDLPGLRAGRGDGRAGRSGPVRARAARAGRPRHRQRRLRCVRRPGPQLRLRALARRRLPVRQAFPRHAGHLIYLLAAGKQDDNVQACEQRAHPARPSTPAPPMSWTWPGTTRRSARSSRRCTHSPARSGRSGCMTSCEPRRVSMSTEPAWPCSTCCT